VKECSKRWFLDEHERLIGKNDVFEDPLLEGIVRVSNCIKTTINHKSHRHNLKEHYTFCKNEDSDPLALPLALTLQTVGC
jgi:hypothetical protein